MRAQEGRRTLTVTGLGARRASSPIHRVVALLTLLACAACATPDAGAAIDAAEVVIGRARWRGHIVLLTDAPALLVVDAEGVAMTRQALGRTGAQVSRLWGLAEDDGRLFTISAFDTLMEIDASGAFVEVARLGRAVLNLLDFEPGMAVQLASQTAGAPLLVALDVAGTTAPLPSPARTALGLTPPEEGLLHLLSCSAPPKPICWLPGDVRIFAAAANALEHRTRLAGLSPPDAASLIAAPERRVIEDALSLGEEGLLVLRNIEGGASQRLTRYSVDGIAVSDAAPAEPLRLLVSDSSRGILAVGRNGRLVIVDK